MSHFRSGIALCLFGCIASNAAAREWADSTGKYSVEADLIAFNTTTVVLKKQNHKLMSVPIDKLSKQDQEYLKSKDANDMAQRSADKTNTWTMRSGLKVNGRVVGYVRKEVTVERRRNKIYVNDRMFDNLPEVYQKMVPKVVGHFENVDIDSKKSLEAWLLKQKPGPHRYLCDGVTLELENGDEYGVPFFFFSEDDLKVLEPGWKRWLAAEDDKAKREHEQFMLQAQAQAYQQDRETSQQIAAMQLQMQAYQAGLFDLWEVTLIPQAGSMARPLMVVVPARDSLTASQLAMSQNSGYAVGAVAKVQRHY
jgi:hypothetical protein